MKKIIIFILFIIFTISLFAQVKVDDFGRIVINTFVSEEINIPNHARKLLQNKLEQITTNNGMGGSSSNPRFIISAEINVGTKNIIPGPPQMVAQNIEVTFYIADAISKTIFSNTALTLTGVGKNENKSLINAFSKINTRNDKFKTFLEDGKKQIINYYYSNCDFIIKKAQTLSKQGKYDEAIYKLSTVPKVCEECFNKCLDNLSIIYQKKIDYEGRKKLKKARSIWVVNQNEKAAKKAAEILTTINPYANCQKEVSKLIEEMNKKIRAEKKAKWALKLRKYEDKVEREKRIWEYKKEKREDRVELEKQRINTYREIAVEKAKNQPESITYNRITCW